MVLGRYIDQNRPVSDHPLNRGLEGWWLPLCNNRGGSLLYDIKGRHHGTLTGGAVWDPGMSAERSGILFSGADQTVLVADWGLRPVDVTASAWFKLSSTPTLVTVLCKNYTTAPWSAPFASFLIRLNSAVQIEFGIGDAINGFGSCVGAVSLSNGVWYHVAIGADGANIYGYLNGVQVATRGWAADSEWTTQPLTIGADHSASPYGEEFPGVITDVAVWSQMLSADEIWAVYRQGLLGHPLTLRRWTPRRLGPPQVVSFPAAKLTTWPPMALGRFGAGAAAPAVAGKFQPAWARRGVIIGGGVY